MARLIDPDPAFRVMAFYTAKNDAAHISFVKEAKKWFGESGQKNGFSFTATDNWDSLNTEVLATVDVVVFLDTRPEQENQRKAFQQYMEKGGAWMGFHFSAFALTPSAYPQNWNWYQVHFLGAGEYVSNTWRPTSAVLKLQSKHHPVTKGLPATFRSSPNEWYRWQIDLRKNPNIKILVTIDSSSFPLGTGPKPHEIWYKGFYPVVWTNIKYHMVYFNMGHNDIDYENKTNKELSHTFGNELQDKMVLQALLWLGRSVRNKTQN
ncbi:MAG TPA: ThuA domain-containing protein [Chitinophagaceae bacterium]|nr:ThuA domain-containing protein [Chitinophagaceae bacterium]